MIVYLAGKLEDHQRFNEYARDLQSRGVQVISTWHQSGALSELLEQWRKWKTGMREAVESIFTDQGFNPELAASSAKADFNTELIECVEKCRDEIQAAEWVIADLDGGSVEVGFALASGKRVITMGIVRSPLGVLYCEEAKAVDSWPQVLAKLRNEPAHSLVDALRIF